MDIDAVSVAYPHNNTHKDTVTDIHRHCSAEQHLHAHIYRDFNQDGNPDCHIDGDASAFEHLYFDCHTHGHGDFHWDGKGYFHADLYTDIYRDKDGHIDVDLHRDRDTFIYRFADILRDADEHGIRRLTHGFADRHPDIYAHADIHADGYADVLLHFHKDVYRDHNRHKHAGQLADIDLYGHSGEFADLDVYHSHTERDIDVYGYADDTHGNSYIYFHDRHTYGDQYAQRGIDMLV
jgi:hypothetical protein